jgi:ribonuclease J
MRLVVLDGANSVGGTKLLAESEGQAVLMDFGLSFSRYQRYFEEFVRPRATRGLVDLRRFQLIPPLPGAYRQDLLIGPEEEVNAKAPEITGLLLTHAHVDHFGVMGTLKPNIPIHCTAATMAILKSTQDSGKPDFWAEGAYVVPRVSGDRPDVIKSSGAATEAVGRPFFSLDRTTAELTNWMSTPASDSPRSRRLRPGTIQASTGLAGPFTYSFHPVDHSVPGCCSFEVADHCHRVLYTGDLRFHGCRAADSHKMIERAALNPPDLLVVEGTRLGRRPGPQVTENDVATSVFDIVSANPGRLVIADFGARHVERLATFLSVAKACSRRLVVTAKDMLLLEGLWAAGEFLVNPADKDILVFDEPRAVAQGWEQSVLSRHVKKLASAKAIRAHPESTILAFGFFDLVELVDIALSDGVYIYSSSECYSEDQRLDLHRLSNWTHEFGLHLRGFRWEGGQNGRAIFDEPLNSSGHLSERDLVMLLETIRPRAVLPVHTERAGWFLEIGQLIGSDVVLPEADGEVRVA